MNETHLNRRDLRGLLAWLLAGLVGLALFVALYERAFPEASVNVVVGRDDAVERSKALLDAVGVDLDGYRHALSFRTDHRSKTFLEKELGLDAVEGLARGRFAIWFWQCRWFKPQEEEEYVVRIAPGGRVVGFRRIILSGAQGATTSADEARTRALAFLEGFTDFDPSEYRLLENREHLQRNRKDHTFIWEHDQLRFGGATYRVSVTIQGDRVGAYFEHLKIPEAWTLDESRKDAHRALFFGMAYAGRGGLMLAAYVVFLVWLRRWRLHFRAVLVLGALLALLTVVGWLNEYTMMWMGYDTKESVGAFVGYRVVVVVLMALEALITIVVVGSAGDALANEAFPGKAPLSKMLTRAFWSSKQVFMASFAGCCLGFVHAAYVTVFYVAGSEVGVWSPMLSPRMDILATPCPWLYPLTIGLSASLNEEFMFRLFAISFLMRYLKRPWIAVTVPAVVWGFLHSNYPQDPAFVRGIELTVVGLVFGVVFLRYGFLTSVVSHYAYNALLSSMVMLRSDDAYLQVSGFIIVGLMVAPVAPGIVMLARRKAFAVLEAPPAESRAPAPLPTPDRSTDTGEFKEFVLLPRRRYVLLWILGAAAVGSGFFNAGERFGDFIEVRVNRTEASAIAKGYLQDQGVEVGQYRTVTYFRNYLRGPQIDFLFQRVGKERLNDLCEAHLPGKVLWITRFYVPLEKEGYLVYVYPGGQVHGYEHVVGEDAPGSDLTQEQARLAAEDYLQGRHSIDLSKYRLVDATTQERTRRTDHSFVWEFVDEDLGEGSLRLFVPVLGDEVTHFTSFVHVPDEWERARSERNITHVIYLVAAITAGALAIMVFGGLFMLMFLRGQLRWRIGIVAGVIFAVLEAVKWANGYPLFWAAYSTQTEPAVYVGEFLVNYGTEAVGGFVGVCLLAVFAEALLRTSYPKVHAVQHWFGVPYWFGAPYWLGARSRGTVREDGLSPIQRLPLRRAWGEALVIGGLLSLLLLSPALSIVMDMEWFHPFGESASIHDKAPPPRIAGSPSTSWLPALGSASACIQQAMGLCIIIALFVGLYRRILKRPRWAAAVTFVVIVLYAARGAGDAAEFANAAMQAAGVLVSVIALTYALARWFLRDNLAAYAMLFFLTLLLSEGAGFAATQNTFIAVQGWILIGVYGFLFFFGLWLLMGRRKADAGTPSVFPQPSEPNA